jgi:hypothetical protein
MIENALERQGWRLEITKTEKWIAIKDDRAEFRNTFKTDRVGKIIGSKIFVTLVEMSMVAQRLILATGQDVEHVVSANGKGSEYPGFDSSHMPGDNLSKFAHELRREIDSCIQK